MTSEGYDWEEEMQNFSGSHQTDGWKLDCTDRWWYHPLKLQSFLSCPAKHDCSFAWTVCTEEKPGHTVVSKDTGGVWPSCPGCWNRCQRVTRRGGKREQSLLLDTKMKWARWKQEVFSCQEKKWSRWLKEYNTEACLCKEEEMKMGFFF